MCNTDDRTDLSRLPDFLYQFFETALKTVAKKRPQYLVVKVVLPAGIVRSGECRDGTAIVRRRRDRVTLFRRSRREYKRDKACASMPCEMVLPAGIVRSGECRDGTAIVRRRRDRVTLFRQSRREDKRDKACVSMPCEMVLPAESNPQRPLRRGLLYPFNYGSVQRFKERRVLPAPSVRRAGAGAPFFYYTILSRKKQ